MSGTTNLKRICATSNANPLVLQLSLISLVFFFFFLLSVPSLIRVPPSCYQGFQGLDLYPPSLSSFPPSLFPLNIACRNTCTVQYNTHQTHPILFCTHTDMPLPQPMQPSPLLSCAWRQKTNYPSKQNQNRLYI